MSKGDGIQPGEFQFARFSLSFHEFGIDVRYLKEIARYREMERRPEAPAFIDGLIRLRTILVPVIDLRKRFSLPEVNDERTRIIIASLDAHVAGLVVDAVNDISLTGTESLSEHSIEGPWAGCVDAVVEAGGSRVMILNLTRLLTDAEKKFLKEPI